MQVSLTLVSSSDQEARSLAGILDLVTGGLSPKAQIAEAIETKDLPAAKAKAKEEKLAKKKPVSVFVLEEDDDDLNIPEVASDDEDDDLDFGSDEEEEEEDEIAPEPPKKRGRPSTKEVEAAPAAAKEIDQSQVIAAFRDYAQKHSREKAGKVLEKFGVKSVRELKKKDYPAVMKIVAK